MTGADAIAIIILLTILIAVGVYLLHWLYRHSSKDQSFVRTGSGGEKVVMGGGALVIPIVHDITVVNMNAIPLQIRLVGEQSLITQNKMRIDLVAEFLVRVIATREGVSDAARTLGDRTQDPLALKEIIQGRFVDAMASVAASMTMEEIHQDRSRYVERVSDLVAKRLGTNGLELENASLTSLNQTDISVFNPSNAFDAEGLTQLTEQIEARRKLRNKIENETRIEIKLKDQEAEQRALEIDRDLEYARIDQARAIEIRKAAQAAEIESERSSSAISIAQAREKADEESQRIRIMKDHAVESERIRSQNEIRALEIERHKDTELTEIASQTKLATERLLTQQQIEAERIERERLVKEAQIKSRREIEVFDASSGTEIEEARLARERAVETRRIETTREIELLAVEKTREVRVSQEVAQTEQDRAVIAKQHALEIERLRKDEDVAQQDIVRRQKVRLAETQSMRKVEDAAIVANRELDEMRVAAEKYIERFVIEQDMEIELADKQRLISVVNKAIEEAVARTDEAKARKALAAVEEQVETVRAEENANRNKKIEIIVAEAAAERDALRVLRRAESEKLAIEHRAQAEIAEAKAAGIRYETDAEGHRKLNEAENMRNDESRRSAIYENLVKSLPQIIRESVKPMENIESIKILQVDGLPGLNSPSESGGGGGGTGGTGPSGGNISDQVVNSAMKYRTQVAFVDGLMEEIGLPLKNLGAAGGMQFRNFPGAPEGKSGKGDD
ncbi:flotillin family protein [Microbaculum marinum]|uniref:Flotillin domain-containing protein n=1 Tax=Microbaculum marinum TaxID=1764581 RepID=A0AAW9R9U6_9HYPH